MNNRFALVCHDLTWLEPPIRDALSRAYLCRFDKATNLLQLITKDNDDCPYVIRIPNADRFFKAYDTILAISTNNRGKCCG